MKNEIKQFLIIWEFIGTFINIEKVGEKQKWRDEVEERRNTEISARGKALLKWRLFLGFVQMWTQTWSWESKIERKKPNEREKEKKTVIKTEKDNRKLIFRRMHKKMVEEGNICGNLWSIGLKYHDTWWIDDVYTILN